MAREVGQMVRRGRCTWLVRVYNGRDLETKKRNYPNQTIQSGLQVARTPLRLASRSEDFRVSCPRMPKTIRNLP